MRSASNLPRRIGATHFLLGAAAVVFSLIHVIPGDPVAAMLGERAAPADAGRRAKQ